MYRDKTLIPTEAVRLCALGILADGPTRYADLAREVRHFAGRIVGPSLDILGPSLELLRYEGLAETENEVEGDGAEALLSITEAGRTELKTLLTSNVRAPIDDVNKLVVALKFRFLHLLAPAESPVYGPNADGRVAQRFGPIRQRNGHRRSTSYSLARGQLAVRLAQARAN